jgi:colanic acid/amylovoran biosynthesis protein
MRVLILNTCSTLNRGDAAIVLGQIRLLQKYCPEARIAITSKTPALDRAFYHHLGVTVLPPLTPALSTYRGFSSKLVEGARTLTAWGEKRRLLQNLQRSDLVLSCGGGYFYSYRSTLPGTTFWQNVFHAFLANALDKPLVFLPQSFGPFGSVLASGGVKRLLEGQNVLKIFAREEASHQHLHRMLSKAHHPRIALCPDMACYLTENARPGNLDGESLNLPRPILALNLRQWPFPDTEDPAARAMKREKYLTALITVAHCFIQRYRGSVVVIPQALGPDPSEDDRPICLEFCRQVQEYIPAGAAIQLREPEASSLTAYMELLSQVTILIGTRLHSCILALVAGVPAISIGYQPKSQGTMDMLGLGRFNRNITDISLEWLLGSVEEIMNQPQEIQQEIRQSLSFARTRIDDQVGSLLKSWLNGRPERAVLGRETGGKRTLP